MKRVKTATFYLRYLAQAKSLFRSISKLFDVKNHNSFPFHTIFNSQFGLGEISYQIPIANPWRCMYDVSKVSLHDAIQKTNQSKFSKKKKKC